MHWKRILASSAIATLSIILFIHFDSEEPVPDEDRSVAEAPNQSKIKSTAHNTPNPTVTQTAKAPQPRTDETDPWGIEGTILSNSIGTFGIDGWLTETRIIESEHAYPFIRFERTPIDTPDPSQSGRSGWTAMVADQMMVRLDRESSTFELETIIRGFGGSIRKQASVKDNLFVVSYKNFLAPETLPNLLSALNRMPGIISFAEPDYLVRSHATPNDPDFQKQWSLDAPNSGIPLSNVDTNARAGWDIRKTAPNTVVAVIDTGTKIDHPDLLPNLWVNPNDPIDGIDNDNNGYVDDRYGINAIDGSGDPTDDNGHGTAVASVIGAKGNNGFGMTGVVWETNIMSLKFLDESGFGSISDAIETVDYAVDNNADIINASWGGSQISYGLQRALDRANEAGVIFVTSAGNEGIDLDSNKSYPASFELPNVLAVAASNKSGFLSSYSNFGLNSVHIAAPGDDILALSHSDNTDSDLFSGTSLAAPLVSGLAILAHEHFGDETPESLKSRILTTARLNNSIYTRILSHGSADLERLLLGTTNIPENDDFQNATELSNRTASVIGNTELATFQSNEPNTHPFENPKTVWFQFELQKPAKIQIETDSWVAVYFGDGLENLVQLEATNFDHYKIAANTPHYIQIASRDPKRFLFKIIVPPENDNFENASVISEPEFDVTGSNGSGTTEVDEPRHGAGAIGASSWWRYDSALESHIVFSTAGSGTDTILAVYEGSELSNLELIGINDDASRFTTSSQVEVDVLAGQSYFLAVDSQRYPEGQIRLSGSFATNTIFAISPQDTSSDLLERARFSGHATGPTPITYQWHKDGTPIIGATDPSLVISSVAETDYGNYQLEATSPIDSILSDIAVLRKNGKLPQFILQPRDTDIPVAQNGSLKSLAVGPGPIEYQWFHNEQSLPNETGPDLTITSAILDNSGTYYVKSTNESGTAISRSTTLFVDNEEALFVLPAAPRHNMDFVKHLVWSNGSFYAIGDPNLSIQRPKILFSTDGHTWRKSILSDQIPESFTIDHAVAGENRLILAYGQNRIASFDTNSSTTTTSTLSSQGSIESLIHGNGIFLATTSDREIFRSTNGSSWTEVLNLSNDNNVRSDISMAYASGFFLSSYSNTGNVITLLKSTDGQFWEPLEAIGLTSSIIQGAGTVFRSSERISENGVNWTETLTYLHSTSPFIYAEGLYYTPHRGQVFVSDNGFEWEKAYGYYGDATIEHLTYGNGTTVFGIQNNRLVATRNLFNIESAYEPELDYLDNIQFVNGEWIATANGFHKSNNAHDWESLNTSFSYSEDQMIHFDDGTYITGSYSGIAVGYSPNTLSVIPGSQSVIDRILAYGNGVSIGEISNEYYLSENGISWNAIPQALPEFVDILFAHGQFIGIASQGSVYTSTTGLDWNSIEINLVQNGLAQVLSTADGFVIATIRGEILTSNDGIAWSLASQGPIGQDNFMDAFTIANGVHYISSNQNLYHSNNLTDWVLHTLSDSRGLERLIPGNGNVFALDKDERWFRIGTNSEMSPIINSLSFNSEYKTNPHSIIEFSIEAIETDSSIEKIEYFIDQTLVHETMETTSVFSWTASDEGVRVITVRVTDSNGNTSLKSSKITTQSNRIKNVLFGDTPQNVKFLVEAFESAYLVTDTGLIYRSSNGVEWVIAHEITDGRIKSLHFGNGRLFVYTEFGLHTSSDGVTWTFVPRNSEDVLTVLGDWLVHSFGDFPRSSFSQDGLNWIDAPASFVVSGNLGSLFLGVDEFQNPTLLEPSGAMRPAKLPNNMSLQRLESSDNWAYGIFRPQTSASAGEVESLFRTRDFVTWEGINLDTPRQSEQNFHISHFKEIDGLFAIDANNRSYVSRDLIKWTPMDPLRIENLFRFGPHYYLANETSLYRSIDGFEWEAVNEDDSNSSAQFIPLKRGIIRLVGFGEKVREYSFSADAFTWERIQFPSTDYEFNLLNFEGGVYTAFDRDYVFTSPDGENWTGQNQLNGIGNKIAFGDGKYIADANHGDGDFASSPNGIDWTFHQSPAINGDYGLTEIVYSNSANRFIALNASDKYYYSDDGLTWTENVVAPNQAHRSLSIASDRIYLESDSREYYSSTDGINWTGPTLFVGSLKWNGAYYGISGYSEIQKSINGIDPEVLKLPIDGDPKELFELDGSLVSLFRGDSPESYRAFRSNDGESWTEIYDMSFSREQRALANGKEFLIGSTISTVTDKELNLSEISNVSGQYKIGDDISAILSIENSGATTISLAGVSVSAQLTNQSEWTGIAGRQLSDAVLPNISIDPNQTVEINVDFNIPPFTTPGEFSLQALLNPDQTIREKSIANNYAWTENAQIVIPVRKLTIEPNTGGTIKVLPEKLTFADGDSVTVVAQPDTRYRIKEWSGVSSSSNLDTSTLSMNSDKTISVEFERIYTPDIRFEGKGSVSINPDKASFIEGENLTIQALPEHGWEFTGWSGDETSETEQLSLTIVDDILLFATFSQTYDSWSSGHFGEPSPENELERQPDADPDLDGRRNLFEFLMGGDPLSRSDSILFEYEINNDEITLRYQKSKTLSGHDLEPVVLKDSQEWTTTGIASRVILQTDDLVIIEASHLLSDSSPTLIGIRASTITE